MGVDWVFKKPWAGWFVKTKFSINHKTNGILSDFRFDRSSHILNMILNINMGTQRGLVRDFNFDNLSLPRCKLTWPQWKPVFNCLGIPWVNKNVIIIIIIIGVAWVTPPFGMFVYLCLCFYFRQYKFFKFQSNHAEGNPVIRFTSCFPVGCNTKSLSSHCLLRTPTAHPPPPHTHPYPNPPQT